MINLRIKKTHIALILSIATFALISCEDFSLQPQNRRLDGQWTCQENHSEEGSLTYTITIDTDERDSTKIYLYNFLDLQQSPQIPVYAYAYIKANSVSIPNQTIAGHTVEGTGTINQEYSKITLSFTDNLYGKQKWNVNSTLTKK